MAPPAFERGLCPRNLWGEESEGGRSPPPRYEVRRDRRRRRSRGERLRRSARRARPLGSPSRQGRLPPSQDLRRVPEPGGVADPRPARRAQDGGRGGGGGAPPGGGGAPPP